MMLSPRRSRWHRTNGPSSSSWAPGTDEVGPQDPAQVCEGEDLALSICERLLGIRKPVRVFYETQLVEDEVFGGGEWRQGAGGGLGPVELHLVGVHRTQGADDGGARLILGRAPGERG